MPRPISVTIHMDALHQNLERVREAADGRDVWAVVKANAYGHGDYEISTHLEKNGVKAFAVATIEEGIRLRRYGIRGMILILGYTDIHRTKELKQYAHLKQLWAAELS